MESSRSTDFFTAGGTFRLDSPSYVKRPAEDDLFELALTGEFCHVLTAYHLDFSTISWPGRPRRTKGFVISSG